MEPPVFRVLRGLGVELVDVVPHEKGWRICASTGSGDLVQATVPRSLFPGEGVYDFPSLRETGLGPGLVCKGVGEALGRDTASFPVPVPPPPRGGGEPRAGVINGRLVVGVDRVYRALGPVPVEGTRIHILRGYGVIANECSVTGVLFVADVEASRVVVEAGCGFSRLRVIYTGVGDASGLVPVDEYICARGRPCLSVSSLLEGYRVLRSLGATEVYLGGGFVYAPVSGVLVGARVGYTEWPRWEPCVLDDDLVDSIAYTATVIRAPDVVAVREWPEILGQSCATTVDYAFAPDVFREIESAPLSSLDLGSLYNNESPELVAVLENLAQRLGTVSAGARVIGGRVAYTIGDYMVYPL